MKIAKAYKLYWQIGKQAVEDSLLTDEELKIICRWGHRKCGYWNRHLLDLIDTIRDRMDRIPEASRLTYMVIVPKGLLDIRE